MTTTAARALLLATLALVGALLVGAPTASAEGQRYLDPVFTDVAVTRGLPYGQAPDENGQAQVLLLDLYEPAGDTATARPTVVLAHGGGFVGGSRGDMGDLARQYAERGYVAASITYRMHEDEGGIGFPPNAAQRERIIEAVHDMQAAVRWVRSQAAARRLHPDKWRSAATRPAP